MSTTQLLTPFLDSAVRWTNFFNGRLLAGEDLAGDQDAVQEILRRFGQATGDGIAFGLEVSQAAGDSVASPTVTVTAGVAVNRQGTALALRAPVDVVLSAGVGDAAPAAAPALFANCEPPSTAVYVAGSGVYLLAVRPVTTREGRAPVSGLGNVAAPCAVKSIVDALQFRLLQFKVTADELSTAQEPFLRNRIAYDWFGDFDQSAVADPFAGVVPRDLNGLLMEQLDDCDVPLAVVYWTSSGGIRFVDQWTVRRPLTPATPDPRWALPVDERRWVDGLAMLLQFQKHIDALSTPGAPSLVATSVFKKLPPVGLLPISGSNGFSQNFFNGLTTRGPIFMEGARLKSLLRWALTFPPIDLSTGEFIWLYLVRENREPIGGVTPAHPYLVFARGDVEFQGEPRFDLSRWEYANFSLGGERTGP